MLATDSVVFVENAKLIANEPLVKTKKWKRPLDINGDYDPSIELELWQYNKLKYTDQLDYILYQIYKTCDALNIKAPHHPILKTTLTFTHKVETSLDTYVVATIDPANLNPRQPKGSGYYYSNRGRWKSVWLDLKFHQRYTSSYDNRSYYRTKNRSVLTRSVTHRPTVMKLLLSLLIGLDTKYEVLKPVLEYYETYGTYSIKTPPKFRGHIS